MTERALTVWWETAPVGRLVMDAHGELGFEYLPDWLTHPGAKPLSWSLPLRPEAFTRRECTPFFDGILPEEAQRENAAAALGVSPHNAFRLLEELGGDVAGAISLWPEGDAPPAATGPFRARLLSEGELRQTLDILPRRPLLAGEEGLRLSLAGAQPKLPVLLTAEGVALPAPGQPTTHILKPPIARFTGSTENEAFAMRLARVIGLDAAEVQIGRAEGAHFLLITRYDRKVDAEGHMQRLHQEDFCQALGKTSARKYASDGGPVFRDLFALLRRVATRPAVEVLKLFDAAIFNLVIGNADAHGKNYSLLYTDRTELAPLYDLLSTIAWPELSPRLAMRIAGKQTLEEIEPRHWAVFAGETGLAEPYVRRRAKEIAALVLDQAGQVPAGFDLEVAEQTAMAACVTRVLRRAESLLTRV